MNKTILTDVDGCLTDWVTGFQEWMGDRGANANPDYHLHYTIDKWYDITMDEAYALVREYNASAAMGFLPAYLDSIHYVKRLHEEHGYKFHAITSMGKNKYARKLRERNLRELFGETTFTRFVFLDANESKRPALNYYYPSDHYFIEDKPENATDSLMFGMTPILMHHDHNGHVEVPDTIPRVNNWQEIYNIIVDHDADGLKSY